MPPFWPGAEAPGPVGVLCSFALISLPRRGDPRFATNLHAPLSEPGHATTFPRIDVQRAATRRETDPAGGVARQNALYRCEALPGGALLGLSACVLPISYLECPISNRTLHPVPHRLMRCHKGTGCCCLDNGRRGS